MIKKKLMAMADKTSIQLQKSSRSTNDLDADLGVIVESLYDFMQQEA